MPLLFSFSTNHAQLSGLKEAAAYLGMKPEPLSKCLPQLGEQPTSA